MSLTAPRLFGRSGSHYTRLARIVAYEAAVDLAFEPVPDIRGLDPAEFGGHPGLKIPTLHDGGEPVFGSLEICRRLVAASPVGLTVIWPEAFPAALRNGWELLSQGMQNQVQLAFGVSICGLPVEHPFFHKTRLGLQNILDWLEDRAPELLAADPPGDLSLFQATLFCLLKHLTFRPTFEPAPLPRLRAASDAFARRASALATPYGMDPPR